jgi:hypothetical protein
MGFLYNAFIRKNTPELRAKLEDLGYHNSKFGNESNKCIVTTMSSEGYTMIDEYLFDCKDPGITWSNGRIDCGYNEELFLAIAALRNDTDKNQWFICQEEYISTHTMDFVKVGTWQLNTQHDKLTYGLKRLWRKASVKELIKHFGCYGSR